MSNDNKRTYADIERVGVIVKLKDDPNTYQMSYDEYTEARILYLLVDLKVPIIREPLNAVEFMERKSKI